MPFVWVSVVAFGALSLAPSTGAFPAPVTTGATSPTIEAQLGFHVLSVSHATSPAFVSDPGDTIVLFFSVWAKNSVSTVTDSAGDHFAALLHVLEHSASGYNSLAIWTAFGVVGSPTTTVTVSLRGSATMSAAIVMVDVTGVGPTPLDRLGTPTNATMAGQTQQKFDNKIAANASDLVLAGVAGHNNETWAASGVDHLVENEHAVISGAPMTAADFRFSAASTANVWMNGTTLKKSTSWIADSLTLKPSSTAPPTKYPVTFSETGLPSGTSWSVTLGASTLAATAPSTIDFSEPNGTYAYRVGNVPGFAPSPSSGSLVVNGGPDSVSISFQPSSAPPKSDDWPTYLGQVTRDAANYGETALSVSDASKLSLIWSATTGNIQAEPAVVNDTVFVGSRGGYEYALNASTGASFWKTYIGQDLFLNCSPFPAGITSSATEIGGMVYVGGGNGSWYALNAKGGSIAWKVLVGSTTKGYYNWASPLIADGFAYIGAASYCDMPLVLGGLMQVSLATHQEVAFFNTTALGTTGASIWGSPSFDAGNNTVFVATGNPPKNKVSVWGEAILALNATTMKLIGGWKVPPSEVGPDTDFGTTPTLLHLSDGEARVVAMNKNGFVYALDPKNLPAGPIWRQNVSTDVQPPNVAPVAWGGGLLYVGSSQTTIGGVTYAGAVRALNATNGHIVWTRTMPGDVLGAPVYANGLVVAGGGTVLDVLNAATGALLWTWTCAKPFLSAPAVAEGRIFAGCSGMFAFGVPALAFLSQRIATVSAALTEIGSDARFPLHSLLVNALPAVTERLPLLGRWS